MEEKKKLDDTIMYCGIIIISILIFISLYGIKVLNPVYVDWLLSGGDLSQHYLGWVAFRKSTWSFPIGLFDYLSFPNLTSIIFTDSIPIFAILFKILSPILPANFQYFGLWGIMSYTLQGIFAAKIIKKYTDSRIAIIFMSGMVILTPSMINRMFVHTALGGQWLILYSLSLLFNRKDYRSKRKIYLHILLLSILTASIHLYFVLMNGIIIVGICLLELLETKRWHRFFAIVFEYIIIIFVIVGLLGGFSSGMNPSIGGLGIFNFNLNGFYNAQGWSCILDDLPVISEYQGSEGFSYLGLGVILLQLLGIVALAFSNDRRSIIRNNWKIVLSLLLIFITAIIVALSPEITIGNVILLQLKLPDFIINIWSIFRASGRIVWIDIYIIEIVSFIIFSKIVNKKNILMPVIIILFIIQIYDIHLVIINKHNQFAKETEYISELKNEKFWDNIACENKIEHIFFYSVPDLDTLYSIVNWSLENDITVNNFYFARTNDVAINNSLSLKLKELPNDCMFIFPENVAMNCKNYKLHYYKIDNMIIGVVDKIEGYDEIVSWE